MLSTIFLLKLLSIRPRTTLIKILSLMEGTVAGEFGVVVKDKRQKK